MGNNYNAQVCNTLKLVSCNIEYFNLLYKPYLV